MTRHGENLPIFHGRNLRQWQEARRRAVEAHRRALAAGMPRRAQEALREAQEASYAVVRLRWDDQA